MMTQLEALKSACIACEKCALSATRTNVVFGEGNPAARVVFVGEAPGANEDLGGRAFVGRAGQVLNKLLCEINLTRDEIYILNTVKCRPPGNRDPKAPEIAECIGFLQEQLRIIKPEFVVCLGRVSASRLISRDFKVTLSHGEFFPREGYEIMGTFHPAALLRSPSLYPRALEDFAALGSRLNTALPPKTKKFTD